MLKTANDPGDEHVETDINHPLPVIDSDDDDFDDDDEAEVPSIEDDEDEED